MREELKSNAVREFEAMMLRQHLAKQAQRVVNHAGEWHLEAPQPSGAQVITSKTREYATMATESLKSTAITNLDSLPVVANTAGIGAAFTVKGQDGYVTTTSGVTVGSIYRMIRLPTTAKIKALIWEAGAMTQGPFDLGVYYSDSTVDGTPVALQGAVVDADRFASAVSAAAIVKATLITNESDLYLMTDRGKPLWQAAGLTADPGGCLDLVFTSTNTITAGALLYLLCMYSE